ncbi:sugar transporter [Aphelenchoides avenae]|nr:sugar transporter [Aphelenchus avenae]
MPTTIKSDLSPTGGDILCTADGVLAAIGATNPRTLGLFFAMSVVWGLSAMPLMASAFMMGEICRQENGTACDLTPGTITEEFNLAGPASSLADLTTSSFLLGNVVGASLARLSDKYGRRPVLIVGLLLVGIIGCLSSFMPEVYSLSIMRFLQGVSYTTCGLANWVLAYESVPRSLHAYSTLAFGLAWVFGYVAVAPLAYIFPCWRSLIIATSAPCIVFAVAYVFWLPESFQFLVLKNRREEVDAWISAANRWSRKPQAPVKVDLDLLLASSHVAALTLHREKPCGLFRYLVKDTTLLIYTVVLAYLWATDTFVYFGLSLFSTQLAGNQYANYVYSGLIEIPAYVIAPFCLNRFGRRAFVAACQCVTSVCFLLLPAFGMGSIWSLGLWLVGKCAVSCAFLSLFVFASEVFPTAHRNGCIGLCEVVARLGGVFSPAIRTLSVVSPIAPSLLCGVSAGLASMLTFILPETSRQVPQEQKSQPV